MEEAWWPSGWQSHTDEHVIQPCVDPTTDRRLSFMRDVNREQLAPLPALWPATVVVMIGPGLGGETPMYEAQISRTNPSAFLFLIDQSGSMDGGWGGDATKKKSEALATILNRLLQNVVLRCAKQEGIRDYYHVGVLGYGARVGSALGGSLAGQDLIEVSRLGDNPIRIEERSKKEDDGAGGLVERKIKLPVWVDPAADNGTPMCSALTRARAILEPWVAQHQSAFPPIVINISDGEPTDGDPSAAAAAIRGLSTADGGCLLLNIHISSDRGSPIVFPSSDSGLPDDHARLLFQMSSELPPFMRNAAAQEQLPTSEGSRGFAFQSDAAAVIQFLDIGTRPSNLADVPTDL